jgi:hypothetical protein
VRGESKKIRRDSERRGKNISVVDFGVGVGVMVICANVGGIVENFLLAWFVLPRVCACVLLNTV